MDISVFPTDSLPGSVTRFLSSDWGAAVIALLIVALVVATRLWMEVRRVEEEVKKRDK